MWGPHISLYLSYTRLQMISRSEKDIPSGWVLKQIFSVGNDHESRKLNSNHILRSSFRIHRELVRRLGAAFKVDFIYFRFFYTLVTYYSYRRQLIIFCAEKCNRGLVHCFCIETHNVNGEKASLWYWQVRLFGSEKSMERSLHVNY